MDIPITKELFCSVMDKLIEDNDNIHELNTILDRFSGSFLLSPESYYSIIRLLEHIFGDKDGWIGWFSYENDFGRGNLQAFDENEQEIPITTTEELYDFLVENYFGGDKPSENLESGSET